MKRLIALAALLLLSVPVVQAQTATPTATPTISPVIHYQGDYGWHWEYDYTLSGNWSILGSGWLTFFRTTSTSAWFAMTISDDICTIAIYGNGPSGNGWLVTLTDGTHNGNWNPINPPNPYVPYIVDSSNMTSDFTMKINLWASGTLDIYEIRLIECPGTATPQPTATPPNTPVPTATILSSSTPANTPVDTATAIPTATPPNTPVPTATILPSSTPANTPVDTPTEIVFVPTPTEIIFLPTPTEINTPVDTPTEIVFLPTPTEINTPVDTPTEINIDPTIAALMTLIAGGPTPNPNTPTPSDTPTITNTPTPEPRACGTLPVSGQMACFDYIATASDIQIGNLLTLIFFSVWAMFLFLSLVLWRRRQ